MGELVVARAVKVAVVSTGDELVGPGEPLGPGQIRDSNRVLLGELATAAGAVVTSEHLGDDAALIGRRLEELAVDHDVILTSGGVSMGAEFDPLRAAVEGHRVDFVRVAVKPAKPLAVGHIGAAAYLGLPGNPVSALVSFALFVRPVLRRLQRYGEPVPATFSGDLAESLSVRPGGRVNLIPMRLGPDGWIPHRIAGSHALASAATAGALAIVAAEGGELSEGDPLTLLPLWSDD